MSSAVVEQENAYQWGLLGASIGAGIGGVVGFALYSVAAWLAAVPVLILGGGGYAIARRALEMKETPPASRAAHCLLSCETTLKRCIDDILNRSRRIWSMQHRLTRESPGSEKQALLQKLQALSDANEQLMARYRAQLWRIELVRWINAVESFADGLFRLDGEQLQQRLEMLPRHIKAGSNMLNEWQASDVANMPEGQACIESLQHALDACDKLQSQLMERNAVLLSREINPIADGLRYDAIPPDVAPYLECFRARVRANSIIGDVETLELEHQRINAEQAAIREVEALPVDF